MKNFIIVVIGLAILSPNGMVSLIGGAFVAWGYYRMGHEDGEKFGVRKAFSMLKRK